MFVSQFMVAFTGSTAPFPLPTHTCAYPYSYTPIPGHSVEIKGSGQ